MELTAGALARSSAQHELKELRALLRNGAASFEYIAAVDVHIVGLPPP